MLCFFLHAGLETCQYAFVSLFTSRPICLLATNKPSVFFVLVYASNQHINIINIWCVPFNFKSSCFVWISVNASYKQRWKTREITHFLFSQPFLTENVSDKCLPTRTLLQVLFRHTFVSVTSFIWIPKSTSILYRTSQLYESQSFFNSINRWCTGFFHSHSFSGTWKMYHQYLVYYVEIHPENPNNFLCA